MQFTSDYMRSYAIERLYRQRLGQLPEDDAEALESVTWRNKDCSTSSTYGASSCPHVTTWFYTVNDARLGQICQVRACV